ncbi:hypothetical protein CBL_12844 [Carabus blaptoides fortunei]
MLSSVVGEEADGTAHLLPFFDRLFDSVNSSSLNAPVGKPLKTPLKEDSAHVDFWNNAVKVLSSMEFIDPITKKVANRPPSLANWISTIPDFQLIWRTLRAAAEDVGSSVVSLPDISEGDIAINTSNYCCGFVLKKFGRS